MSALDIAAKGIAAAKAAKAAKRAEPFYSAVDEAAKTLTRGKGTGKEFMIEVLKKPGVKPTEIKERGLQKIEALPKMTKEEFLQKLEENPAPKLTESGYAEDPSQIAFSEVYYRAVGHLPPEERLKAWMSIPEKQRDRMLVNAEDQGIYKAGTKYEKWKLPGGANYREILIKTPSTSSRKVESEIKELRKEYDQYEAQSNELRNKFPIMNERPPEAQAELFAIREKQAAVEEQMRQVRKDSKSYHSGHWEDDPNVLAHIRVSDREGPNGELILHVEEIQSDWHQAGRKKGYASGEEKAQIEQLLNEQQELKKLRKELHNKAGALPDGREDEFISLMDQANNITPQVMKLQTEIEKLTELQRTAVPDAPFKKNWHELAMKRVLNYAADHGYDKVAITPGAEQASRYDLSKQVDAISWNPTSENRNLLTIDTGDRKITASYDPATGTFPEFESGNFGGKTLDDVVGKEMAERILSEKSGNLSGEGLSIGGEGMKGFYDKIVPDYLNTYGKKYGVQVQMEGLPVKISDDLNFPVEASEAAGLPSHVPGETRNLHAFDITPEMRQDIMGKGLPLYQQIGIPAGGAAAGAEALQQDEQGYADGGAVTGPVGSEYDTTPDMQDGGRVLQGTAFKKGGRVHLSKNSDTMLLDLLSKS